MPEGFCDCGLPDNCGDCDHTTHNAFVADKATMDPDTFKMFYTDDGWLSDYSLGCGYIEHFEHKPSGTEVRLYGEHCNYHVRAHGPEGRIFWDSFDTLEEAQAKFTSTLTILKGH